MDELATAGVDQHIESAIDGDFVLMAEDEQYEEAQNQNPIKNANPDVARPVADSAPTGEGFDQETGEIMPDLPKQDEVPF